MDVGDDSRHRCVLVRILTITKIHLQTCRHLRETGGSRRQATDTYREILCVSSHAPFLYLLHRFQRLVWKHGTHPNPSLHHYIDKLLYKDDSASYPSWCSESSHGGMIQGAHSRLLNHTSSHLGHAIVAEVMM